MAVLLDESADELTAFHDLKRLDGDLYYEMVTLARRANTLHRSPRDLLGAAPQVVALARDRRRGQA